MEKLLNNNQGTVAGKQGGELNRSQLPPKNHQPSANCLLSGDGKNEKGENVKQQQQPNETAITPPDSIKQFFLLWEVPVSQFEINEGLYKPKEPIFSQVLSTPLDKISLFWQMSLAQDKDATHVNLIYKTPGIPNLGISYNIHVLKKDGGEAELTTQMSQVLGGREMRGGVGGAAQMLKLNQQPPAAGSPRSSFIFANNMVKLRLIMKISQTLFSPSNIIKTLVAESREETKDCEEKSLMGKNLWKQIDGANHYPPLADVKFLCRNKEIRFAHRSVLSAFSPKFLKVMMTVADQNERWYHIGAENIGGKTIREILYFIYHREISSEFHFGRAHEMLQAIHDLQQPAHLKLEVEQRLVNTMVSEGDSPGGGTLSSKVSRRQIYYLWSVAEKYDLKIVKNMIVTAVGGDKAKELHDFYETEKSKGQLFDQHPKQHHQAAEAESSSRAAQPV